MTQGKSKKARPPAWEDREQWRATKAEAIERGWQFYWPGRPCRGRKSGPHDAWHSVSQGCLKCKQLTGRRYRYGEDEAVQASTQLAAATVGKRRDDLGLDRAAMHGGGKGYRALIPQQAIARPDDAATNKKVRLKLKGDRDHIVPVPSRRDHDNLIVGLECAENLQGLSRGQNQAKGDGCPLPSDFTRKAGRPLTVDEARWFVQHRMAVWAHDVVFGDPARISWHLYRIGADGVVEYHGFEPTLPVGNAALLLDLQAFEEACGDMKAAARARGLKPLELRDRLVEADRRGLVGTEPVHAGEARLGPAGLSSGASGGLCGPRKG